MTLVYTGERMVPEASDYRTFWEHIYRYRFAAERVAGKRVLDIACGEGYGSAALIKAGATSVVGVDISSEACAHAKQKYGIDARVGDAANIPVASGSIDVVVSFETIEHVPDPVAFVSECARVLSPRGKIIISTPNKLVYNEITPNNPFHCSEMSAEDFVRILGGKFQDISLFSQYATASPWWSLRGLAVERWFWKRIRGGNRTSRAIIYAFAPHLRPGAEAKFRENPAEAITMSKSKVSEFFSPFSSRTYKEGHHPTYIIGCASLRG